VSEHDAQRPAAPGRPAGGRPPDERTPEERRADHAAIDRLAAELLPALVAKLGASGLGELEVREGAWRVRLRMPGDGRGTRRTQGPGRLIGRGETHPAQGAGAPGRGETHPAPGAGAPGPRPAALTPAVAGGADPAAEAPTRAIATSPAVGYFRPRPDLAVGSRVRAGDRIGTVDVLGVPQEVVAPADGLVGATLVEPGAPVEYGQEVVEIALLGAVPAREEAR
jgi:biotin carboxyl carrier protein